MSNPRRFYRDFKGGPVPREEQPEVQRFEVVVSIKMEAPTASDALLLVEDRLRRRLPADEGPVPEWRKEALLVDSSSVLSYPKPKSAGP